MKIQDMLHKRAALLDANSAVIKKAEDEQRALSDEERTTIKANLDGADRFTADIELSERQNKASAVLDASAKKGPHIEVKAENAGNAPFANLGDFLCAVAKAGSPDNTIDPRLFRFTAPTGANEGIPSQGGFLVQQDLVSGLLQPTYERAVLAPRCRRWPVGANANGIKINSIDETSRADGSRWGGVSGYWLAEAGTKTPSKPKFKQIELNLKKVAGLFYATDELLQDATALDAVIRDVFPAELAWQLDDKIMNGTGAGVPAGLLTASCKVAVTKETGQLAATIVYENLVKMWARMPGWLRGDAVWLYNQEIEPQLFTLGITLGTGGAPVWLPPGGISGQPYATLFGRPFLPCQHCAALGTEGDIVLVSLGEYALIDKGGIQTASSIHVNFVYDETVFRFVYRVDGRPMWSSALTPYKGSATLSPIVTLQTRS